MEQQSFQFAKAWDSSCSLRTRTTNKSLSTIPVTGFSRSSYGSTLAPPVNTPVSPPIQPVSLPYNNNNSTGNFKGSRGIAPFIAIFPSRFQWWEHKHGRDVCSLVLPVFRYACYALAYFNSSFAGPLVVSTLPATSSTPLPVVVGGSCGGTTRSVSSMFPSLNKAFVVGLSYAPVLYKLVSKNFSLVFCRPGRLTSRQC